MYHYRSLFDLWEHLLFDLGCENYFSLTWDVKIIQPHRSNTCSWIAMGAKKGNQRAVRFDWKVENYATAMGLELSNSWDIDKSIRRGICIIWGLEIRYEDEIWYGDIVSGTFIQSATKMPAALVWIVCLSMRAGRGECWNNDLIYVDPSTTLCSVSNTSFQTWACFASRFHQKWRQNPIESGKNQII